MTLNVDHATRNDGHREFTVYEASLYRLAYEHSVEYGVEPNGAFWYCTCGRRSEARGSHDQAVARAHLHLRGAQRRIQREIEAAIDLGGCGTPWTDDDGGMHTCNDHNRDLLFVHADDVALWDGGGRYEFRS